MKKYIAILALGMSLAPLVFTASNQAKIEKQKEILVVEDLNLVPFEPLIITYHDFTFKPDFLAPEAIVIEPVASQLTEWKPFGKVRTKYHAEWLFNPLKLC